jgi:L-threonylcarbamoyladenylate synthase
MINNWNNVITVVKNGGVVVVPTDTLYGILARADCKRAVESIYKLKGRDENKPFIVLITDYTDLKQFGIAITLAQQKILETLWPGKVSVILPCANKKYEYLHRGAESLAFRMIGPRNRNLYHLIRTAGPLVAPSANPQGQPPAKTKREARRYFGDAVDAYICGGTRMAEPSTLVRFIGATNSLEILRKGGVNIKTTS